MTRIHRSFSMKRVLAAVVFISLSIGLWGQTQPYSTAQLASSTPSSASPSVKANDLAKPHDNSFVIGYDDVLATQTVFAGLDGIGWDPVALRLLMADNGTRIRQIFFTPPTTTTLTSSANPTVPASQITLQATVSPVTATGSVRFYLGATGNSLLSGSVASNGWGGSSKGCT